MLGNSQLTRGFVMAIVVISFAVGTATAAPAASSSALGLKADGLRLQGMADRYQWLQGLKADGLRLRAAGRFYKNRPAASYYTPEALKAQALRWQGIAAMYKTTVASMPSDGFDWRDAGIGAGVGVAAFLSLVSLVVALRRGTEENPAV